MSRLAIQILFVLLGLAWLGYVAVDLFGHTFGDCVDASCENYRSAMRGMITWRGLFVALMLILAYRFFRKERDV